MSYADIHDLRNEVSDLRLKVKMLEGVVANHNATLNLILEILDEVTEKEGEASYEKS